MNSDNNNRSDSNDIDDFFGADDFGEFEKQLDSSKEKQEQEKLIQKPKEKNPYSDIIEDFILTYQNGLYFNQIKNIIQESKKSIILDYNHIIGFNDQLSDYLLTNPIEFISNFKDVLNSIDKDSANAWYNRAVYYANENKTDESLSDLNHTIMLDKKYGYDALEDKDFNKINDDPKFIELL